MRLVDVANGIFTLLSCGQRGLLLGRSQVAQQPDSWIEWTMSRPDLLGRSCIHRAGKEYVVGDVRSEAEDEAKRGLNELDVLYSYSVHRGYRVNLKFSRSAIGDPALIGRS